MARKCTNCSTYQRTHAALYHQLSVSCHRCSGDDVQTGFDAARCGSEENVVGHAKLCSANTSQTICSTNTSYDERRQESAQTTKCVCALPQYCTTALRGVAVKRKCCRPSEALFCEHKPQSFVVRTQATMRVGQKLHKILKIVYMLPGHCSTGCLSPVIAALATMSGVRFDAAGCG